MTKNIFALLAIFIASLVISLPFLEQGLFQIHDDQQVARLFLFDQSLKYGQFPVRWVESLGFGFGYPLFVFYPPFVYMVGEMFHLFGFGFIDSIKLVFILSILLSGVSMYIFTKELWGKFPALIAAIFYLLVPYRAIDVYIRGALAESFSFIWPPLILWAFYKLFKTQKSVYVVFSAIFLALLMITHNLIFLPFMLLLPIYLLFLLLKSDDKRSRLTAFIWSGLLAAGLSAFFWIPAILEKQFTIVDRTLLTNLADYKIHFVYPQQLWNWPWGFGGSAEGLIDGISFKIGKIHILVSISVAIFAFLILVKRSLRKKIKDDVHLILLFFFLFLLSAYLTTFYSKFIWDYLKPLAYLQFPWRYLLFTGLFSSIIAGALIFLLRLTILRIIFGVLILVFLFIPNLKLFQPQSFRPDLSDNIATSSDIITWDVSRTSFEYIPKGVELFKDSRGVNMVNISKLDIPKEKITVISGQTRITDIKEEPDKIIFQTESDRDSKIQANVFNFPGWQVKIDDTFVPITDNNSLKLINFSVGPGNHLVEIEFSDTKTRLVANLISLFSIFAIVFLLVKKWQAQTKS